MSNYDILCASAWLMKDEGNLEGAVGYFDTASTLGDATKREKIHAALPAARLCWKLASDASSEDGSAAWLEHADVRVALARTIAGETGNETGRELNAMDVPMIDIVAARLSAVKELINPTSEDRSRFNEAYNHAQRAHNVISHQAAGDIDKDWYAQATVATVMTAGLAGNSWAVRRHALLPRHFGFEGMTKERFVKVAIGAAALYVPAQQPRFNKLLRETI
jgi:hypothetical protein